MLNTVLQLLPFIMKLLVGAGLISDPDKEHEVRTKLIEMALRKDIQESQEFVEFVRATSPDARYVWPIINSLQAITRPALTWIIMLSIVASFFVDGLSARIAETLTAFGQAGPAGLLFIAIPAWWFFGRSIERMVPGLAMLRGEEVRYDGGAAGAVTTAPRRSPGTNPAPGGGSFEDRRGDL